MKYVMAIEGIKVPYDDAGNTVEVGSISITAEADLKEITAFISGYKDTLKPMIDFFVSEMKKDKSEEKSNTYEQVSIPSIE